MKIFSASYNGVNCTPSNKSYKISFCVDETERKDILELANSLNIGSVVLVMVFDTETDREDIENLAKTETPEQTKVKLQRMMYVYINETAKRTETTKEKVKSELKQYLINEGLIIKSSTELDLKGLALAISWLKNK